MEKDDSLMEVYLKIHLKKPLTMDDLRCLAEYDPECFVKTCQNIVRHVPETKKILEPSPSSPPEQESKPEPTERQKIEKILENLKRLERHEFYAAGVDMDNVKNLLGNLYMELLLSHKDSDMLTDVSGNENSSIFDTRA